MSYFINQDIIDRVGTEMAAQLTTDSGSVPDQDVLDEVRQSAEGEANAYLARRYDVPVDTSDAERAAMLKGIVLDIAVYRLMLRRVPVSDDHVRAYEAATAVLTKIARGEIVLPGASTPASTEADSPKATYGSQDQNLSTIRGSS